MQCHTTYFLILSFLTFSSTMSTAQQETIQYNHSMGCNAFHLPEVRLLLPKNNTRELQSKLQFSCFMKDTVPVQKAELILKQTCSPTRKFLLLPHAGEYSHDSSMQVWMHFNKDTIRQENDTTVFDYSMNKHGGAVVGALWTDSGMHSGAYRFYSSNSYILLPQDTYGLASQKTATIAAWVYPFSTQNAVSGSILYLDNGILNRIRIQLTVNNNRSISMKCRPSFQTLQTSTSMERIPPHTWSHIAGVVDLTTQSISLYINGSCVKHEIKPFTDTCFDPRVLSKASIGGIEKSSTSTFEGCIDEVALFNRALSDSEIQSLFKSNPSNQWHTSFVVDTLKPGQYRWNYKAYSSNGKSATSPMTRSFTIPSHIQREKNCFRVSIDTDLFKKWGCHYPVTYKFHFWDTTQQIQVYYKDSSSCYWKPLTERTVTDSYNGINAVRFDRKNHLIYVSYAFTTNPFFSLFFNTNQLITYAGPATLYDNRYIAYTLSLDNWGQKVTANPGRPCSSPMDSAGDKYQAAFWTARHFELPVSIGINTHVPTDSNSFWDLIQNEIITNGPFLDLAVHSKTHPCSNRAYLVNGYVDEIIGCKKDILSHVTSLAYGDYIYEFIIPCGFVDENIDKAASEEFIFVRNWNGTDNEHSTYFTQWNPRYGYYGNGGFETKSYDLILEKRTPKGIYYKADVDSLNAAFDAVAAKGGIFYAMWHPDRYENRTVYDTATTVQDGVSGSSLYHHLSYVSQRKNVWYVANGWLYLYRLTAEKSKVVRMYNTSECALNSYQNSTDTSNP